ncbi:hypothetical protein L6452_22166 [Arctium lappa]|uniref:Uncharacterized protein n=1 Tax=Arctium lappa TaxID=4217 RepID=A0ACB9AZX4_ARCLA|nr:hypothetical protein L6452_22166 [Arctium lappa]
MSIGNIPSLIEFQLCNPFFTCSITPRIVVAHHRRCRGRLTPPREAIILSPPPPMMVFDHQPCLSRSFDNTSFLYFIDGLDFTTADWVNFNLNPDLSGDLSPGYNRDPNSIPPRSPMSMNPDLLPYWVRSTHPRPYLPNRHRCLNVIRVPGLANITLAPGFLGGPSPGSTGSRPQRPSPGCSPPEHEYPHSRVRSNPSTLTPG